MRKPVEGRLPDYLPEERPKFAGAYFAERVFGGDEEGGWWYNIYDHQASVLIPEGQDPMAVALALWKSFPTWMMAVRWGLFFPRGRFTSIGRKPRRNTTIPTRSTTSSRGQPTEYCGHGFYKRLAQK